MDILQTVTNFIQGMGLDAGVIIGIVFLSKAITYVMQKLLENTVEESKLLNVLETVKRFHVLVPIALGFLAAFSFSTDNGVFEISIYIKSAFAYAGVSSLVYNLVKKTVLGK